MSAVLFDLDGTLIDTAPDMAASLNHILKQEGLPFYHFLNFVLTFHRVD